MFDIFKFYIPFNLYSPHAGHTNMPAVFVIYAYFFKQSLFFFRDSATNWSEMIFATHKTESL